MDERGEANKTNNVLHALFFSEFQRRSEAEEKTKVDISELTPGGTKRNEQARRREKDDEQSRAGREGHKNKWEPQSFHVTDREVRTQGYQCSQTISFFLCLHCGDIIFPVSGSFALIHHT